MGEFHPHKRYSQINGTMLFIGLVWLYLDSILVCLPLVLSVFHYRTIQSIFRQE